MIMEMSFPQNLVVEAHFRGHTIRSDQPERIGGQNSAPAPFDLFLASIGTCAGYYVLRFCRQRDIGIQGLRMTLEPIRDSETRRIIRLRLAVELPPGFPKKYNQAVVRAIDQCAVKRTIVDPPEFEVLVGSGG